MKIIKSFIYLASAWLCSVEMISAQALYRQYGEVPTNMFGSDVAIIGDINADSIVDYIVGEPGWGGGAGRVTLYSGINQSQIYSITGNADSLFGFSLTPIGDINNDGKIDFSVGSIGKGATTCQSGTGGTMGSVKVYSGLDGSFIYGVAGGANGTGFGASVRSVGDIDQDAKIDFIVSEPDGAAVNNNPCNLSRGRAYVYSGASGVLLFSHMGPKTLQPDGDYTYGGPSNVSGGVGDINADGRPDYAISFRAYHPSPKNYSGYDTYVYSGASGSQLLQVEGGGSDVDMLGDVNADGYSDFLIAGHTFAWHGVKVISGFNGQDLLSISDNSNALGYRVRAVGDRDNDGKNDFIFGREESSTYYMRIHSGTTGTVMQSYPLPRFPSPPSVAIVGTNDLNNDGILDLLIGCASELNFLGAVYRSVPYLEVNNKLLFEPIRMLIEQ